MRAARYHGTGDIRVEEVPRRSIQPDEVRIDVAACGICGSDLKEYVDGPSATPTDPHPLTGDTLPVTMGHEIGGTLVDVGSEVGTLEPGTNVAVSPVRWCGECRRCSTGNYHLCEDKGWVGFSGDGGGFADEVIVSREKAIPLPAGVPAEMGALAEPFTVGLHAIHRSAFDTGDVAAVFGCGPIGLTVIQNLRAAGAQRIYASEPQEQRRTVAEGCGADVVIDPFDEDPVDRILADSDGVDVAFEVAGTEASLNQAISSTKPTGDTTVVSIFDGAASIRPGQLVSGERTIRGTASRLSGPRSLEEFDAVVSQFERDNLDPASLVTSRIALDDVESGFQQLLQDDVSEMKILVKP